MAVLNWGYSLFRCVLLVCLTLSALKSQASRSPYTVLIAGDEMVYSRWSIGREIRKLERQFGREVLLYEVDSMGDFFNVLKTMTQHKIEVENLIVRGVHGTNVQGLPVLEVRENKSDGFDFTSFRDLELAGVRLNFSQDARIHFDSCRMLPESDDPKQILKAFREVLRLGPVQNVTVFLNQSDGANGVQQMFGQPFFAAPGSVSDKLRALAGQLIWPIILPVFAYRDRYVSNQGYWMQWSNQPSVRPKLRRGRASEWEEQRTH